MKIKTVLLGSLMTMALAVPSLKAGEATAFDLAKEGNKYIGEQAKDKVVQIRSEKSLGSLTPNIWYVVYFDPTASLKAVEVKFGAGKMLDVKRPMRLFEPVTGDDKQLDPNKLKIDSPKALKIAQQEPLLKNLTLTASQLWLERKDGETVWKIRLWAAKLREPSKEVEIGQVFISAEKGEVIKNELKVNRAG